MAVRQCASRWLFILSALVLLSPCLWAQNSNIFSANGAPQGLTCSPAPCVLPNVRVSGGHGGALNNEIVVNPADPSQMLVSSQDGNCASLQGTYSSSDGGSRWVHSCVTTRDGVGEPMVAYDMNGTAYAGGIQDWTNVVLRASSDNGVHWGPSRVPDGDSAGVLWPWLTADTSPSSPFNNSLYLSAMHGGVYGQNTRMHVSVSHDGGKHWTGKFLDKWQYPDIDLFSHLAIGADGTVYATWLRCSADVGFTQCNKNGVRILLSKSTDGGHTWSSPSLAATLNFVGPDNCLYGCLPNTVAGISNIPVTAVLGNGNTATVYLVFYNWTGTQMQIEVVTSTDGGRTFGLPKQVTSSDFGDQFFPWISLSQDGTLAVTWLDRRNDPRNTEYQPFLATSTDGRFFSPSHSLTQVLSDPGLSFADLGKFRTHAWVGTAVYSVWMDTRSGEPRIELGGAMTSRTRGTVK